MELRPRPSPTSLLTDDVLDRIEEIVPPATTIDPADNSFDNAALAPRARLWEAVAKLGVQPSLTRARYHRLRSR